MRFWRIIFLFVPLMFFFHAVETVEAHVIDEVSEKRVQARSYSNNYSLVQQYKGKSGVLFESYSDKWVTINRLQALEKELLNNKHGEELAYLGKVQIFPDYPAGQNVLGQYFARYEYSASSIRYSKDRTIQLYGGNDYTTPEQMARVLSHEYGHHFTFFHLIEKEKKHPNDWLSSNYMKARALDRYSKVHMDDTGEYIWSLAEILAEDYVQLFGSENAIKYSMQMNHLLDTPFDGNDSMNYWSRLLNDPQYKRVNPFQMYVTNYHYVNQRYDLQLYIQNATSQQTYIRAQDLLGRYAPVLLDEPLLKGDLLKWYYYGQLPSSKAWIFNRTQTEGMKLQAIQHANEGFNIGSETLTVNYATINQSSLPKAQIYKNESDKLTVPQIKEIIREVAIDKGIPAELLKAIAFIETGWKQFDESGQPLISEDGGIGLMQITASDEELRQKNIDKERLLWDTRYNIEVGAQWLLDKWNVSFLPKINKSEKNRLEDWYFAVMAYNGLSKRNDPSYNDKPYQEKVFDLIRNHGLLQIGNTPSLDIRYPDPARPDLMSFGKSHYVWSTDNRTTQNYRKGEFVYTSNPFLTFSRLRDGIDGNEKKQLPHYTPLEIVAGPYEPKVNTNNLYVWYKVKGNGFDGYIASANLIKGNVSIFKDITSSEVASAVSYLQLKDIISGYEDGTFRPNRGLYRHHAARLLVKALDLKLPKGYQLKATDMKPGDVGYTDMLIAEAHGLMGVGGKLKPNEFLTRSQMASILVRAFENYYEQPEKNYSFTDITPDFWNYGSINVLAHNKITVADPFRPSSDVTRSQFALFLERTIKLGEK